MIQLTAQQSNAAQLITLWHGTQTTRKTYKPYFFLTGPAGSGKTTLIRYVIQDFLNLTIPDIQTYRNNERKYRNQDTNNPKTNPTGNRFPPPSYPTAFAAFTAKAAQVMQSKHIPASTIHALLYAPVINYELIADLELQLAHTDRNIYPETYASISAELKEAKRPKFKYIPPSNPFSRLRYTKLIVLDECSMIDNELFTDLLNTNIPLLILGDLNQLPPITPNPAPFAISTNKPDFELTEIHRQSQDNPIINFATAARTKQQIPFKRLTSPNHSPSHPQLATRIPIKTFQSQHINTSTPQIARTSLTWFDQILCATHRRRQFLNRLYRQLTILPYISTRQSDPTNSLPIFPQIGEKIVCGENDHDLQLYNGQIYTVTDIDQDSYDEAIDALIPTYSPTNTITPPIKFKPIASTKTSVPNPDLVKFQLAQTDPTAPPGTSPSDAIDSATKVWVRAPVAPFFGYNDTDFIPSNDFVFDYGYAITVHKSQGSQWARVLIWNEKMHASQTPEDYAKWLYTALTRASDCVVLAG